MDGEGSWEAILVAIFRFYLWNRNLVGQRNFYIFERKDLGKIQVISKTHGCDNHGSGVLQ